MFGRADFERLAGQLAGIRGQFIMSINDTPGVRETFAAFHLREVTTTYTVGHLASTKAAELIVSNFAPPPVE